MNTKNIVNFRYFLKDNKFFFHPINIKINFLVFRIDNNDTVTFSLFFECQQFVDFFLSTNILSQFSAPQYLFILFTHPQVLIKQMYDC